MGFGSNCKQKKFYCILLKGQIQTALFLTSKNCKKGDQIQIFSLQFTLQNRDIRLFSICHVLCSRKLELRVWRKMKNSLQQKKVDMWIQVKWSKFDLIELIAYSQLTGLIGTIFFNDVKLFALWRLQSIVHQMFFHQGINLCSRLYDLALNFPRRWEYGCTSLVKS